MSHKKTRHHIIPQSRSKVDEIRGICKVEAKIHDLSHQLFGNMTPHEILRWLNENLWGNRYEITIQKMKKNKRGIKTSP